jgi:hypothetical protein
MISSPFGICPSAFAFVPGCLMLPPAGPAFLRPRQRTFLCQPERRDSLCRCGIAPETAAPGTLTTCRSADRPWVRARGLPRTFLSARCPFSRMLSTSQSAARHADDDSRPPALKSADARRSAARAFQPRGSESVTRISMRGDARFDMEDAPGWPGQTQLFPRGSPHQRRAGG